jgi:ferritin-like metal-binding protein YciE
MNAMMKTLQNLFVSQLQDAYSAETQMLAALPKLAKAAKSEGLKEGLQTHLRETQEQVRRLEEACRLVDCPTGGETCEAMQGLITEGEEAINLQAEDNVKDAALIAAAQKVEHYEIALYGCLCSWAQELGLTDVGRLLHQTLEEEKQADGRLTELAESRINVQARR